MMAHESKRRKENIEGSLFVDSTCIDCDTCRWMAPEIYSKISGMSAVVKQPETEKEKLNALQALFACPTASIGYLKDFDQDKVLASFPILIEDNVYHCGYHSPKSFGATSYFIKRKAGNILVDSPRFTKSLVKRLEELGGIKYIFLSHKDDVADHEKFAEHFSASRIIHKKELCDSIKDAEILVDQSHSFTIDETEDSPLIIPTPGHTEGHLSLLYKNKFLFSGDHIAYSARLNQLVAFRNYCQYSWDKLAESVEKLIKYNFEWILPGHGRRINSHPQAFKAHIEKCLEWMRTV